MIMHAIGFMSCEGLHTILRNSPFLEEIEFKVVI